VVRAPAAATARGNCDLGTVLVFLSLTFLLRKLRSEVLENLGLNGCVPSFFASMMIEKGLIVCGYALPESRPPCRRR
jgi:glucose-6-phosphate-specific signal transduction histidine kinase